MLRQLLARLAYELAKDAMNRAETSEWMRDFIRHRGASRFWSDVEMALTGGHGTFRELRAKRRNAVKDQATRLRQPFAGLPMISLGVL